MQKERLKGRADLDGVHGADDAADVVAEGLHEDLVDHGGVGLGADAVAELGLHHVEAGLDV